MHDVKSLVQQPAWNPVGFVVGLYSVVGMGVDTTGDTVGMDSMGDTVGESLGDDGDAVGDTSTG